MSDNCVHGFTAQHCAECRTCRHGAVTSRCSRCRDPLAIRAEAKRAPAAAPVQDHRGHEVYFVPNERSWYVRAVDAPESGASYRSAFLAKRAIDAALEGRSDAASDRREGTSRTS